MEPMQGDGPRVHETEAAENVKNNKIPTYFSLVGTSPLDGEELQVAVLR